MCSGFLKINKELLEWVCDSGGELIGGQVGGRIRWSSYMEVYTCIYL